ncbi:hypothetical protein G6514_006290 [Epicoccum nigrum]|nr:hypothetical protein G6514_006290 [Epicoccum nigrum]
MSSNRYFLGFPDRSDFEILPVVKDMILTHVSTLTIFDAETKARIWPTARLIGDRHLTYETDSTTDEQDSDGNTIPRLDGIKQDKGKPGTIVDYRILFHKDGMEEHTAHAVAIVRRERKEVRAWRQGKEEERAKSGEKRKRELPRLADDKGVKHGEEVVLLFSEHSTRGFVGAMEALWLVVVSRTRFNCPSKKK